jgi:hypothetical protein
LSDPTKWETVQQCKAGSVVVSVTFRRFGRADVYSLRLGNEKDGIIHPYVPSECTDDMLDAIEQAAEWIESHGGQTYAA